MLDIWEVKVQLPAKVMDCARRILLPRREWHRACDPSTGLSASGGNCKYMCGTYSSSTLKCVVPGLIRREAVAIARREARNRNTYHQDIMVVAVTTQTLRTADKLCAQKDTIVWAVSQAVIAMFNAMEVNTIVQEVRTVR